MSHALCVALGFLLTSGLTQGAQRGHDGGRVCAQRREELPHVQKETFLQPQHTPYLTLCGGRVVCSTYRTTYRVGTREVRRTVYRLVSQCCPGWRKRHPTSQSCDVPVCSRPCRNGGSCVGPNRCTCRRGWAGPTCSTDVDECQSAVQVCGQRCVNVPGSYQCECRSGFQLMIDGTSCRSSAAPAPTPAGSDGAGDRLEVVRGRLGLLEEKMEWTLSTFAHLILAVSDQTQLDDPLSVENTRSLISHFQQLDRIDSLSEQIAFLEERLDSCSCREGQ